MALANKKITTGTVLAVLSAVLAVAGFFVALAALVVSFYSAYIAEQAKNDARAVARLDLRPQLWLNTRLRKIPNVSRQYTIKSIGPIEAVDIEIQFYSHRYSETRDKIWVTEWGSEYKKTVPALAPDEHRQFQLSDYWLDVQSRMGEPLHHNVIEIRLRYRRRAGKYQYLESAFFSSIQKESGWVKAVVLYLTKLMAQSKKPHLKQHSGLF